jgi:hypothetical protein
MSIDSYPIPTKPVNVHDTTLFIPLFTQLTYSLSLHPKIVLGDSIYDSEKILSFVIDELKALPRIARNYRWKTHRPVRLSPRGNPLCFVGFEMIYWGKFPIEVKYKESSAAPSHT